MTNKYMSAFADNLKLLMNGMSARELQDKVNIPHQTISRYLLCQRQITLENLCKIADYFDESIDFLLGRREY